MRSLINWSNSRIDAVVDQFRAARERLEFDLTRPTNEMRLERHRETLRENSQIDVSQSLAERALEERWVEIRFHRGVGESSSVILCEPIYSAEDSVLGWSHHDLHIEPEELEILLEEYKNSFVTQEAGSIDVGPYSIAIRLSRHRPAHVSEEQIAHGYMLYNELQQEWKGANLRASFYANDVVPHLPQVDGVRTPVEWVADRVKVIGGTVTYFAGYDYPLAAVEEPLRMLAPVAVNLQPSRHREPFNFARNEDTDRLFEQVGRPLSPECAYLLLSVPPAEADALLKGEKLQQFLGSIDTYVHRGLCVDRIIELAHSLSPAGPQAAAVEHALDIVMHLFTENPDVRPWWFKEDRSLVPLQTSSEWGTEGNRQQHLELARVAGPVYQYAADIWEQRGVSLASLPGVSLEQAVSFVSQITSDYGIGNISRGCNVMDFALAALREIAPKDRPRSLSQLAELLSEKKPASIVFGVLEGGDATFEKPGIFSLIHNLAAQSPVGKLSHLTISPSDLVEAVQLTARPLVERARIEPKLQIQPISSHLITDLSQAGVLRLPVAEELRLSGKTDTPINTWIAFDRQVAREIPEPWRRAGIAQSYLALYAAKFPDPFNPPEGFLSFLNRFQKIPDPDWRFSGLEHPDDRAHVRRQNSLRQLNRELIISSVIDSALVGLFSWEKAVDLLNWMVVESDAKKESAERIALQKEFAWSEYWLNREQTYLRQERWAEFDAELRERQHALGRESLELSAELRNGSNEWLSRRSARVDAELKRIAGQLSNIPEAWEHEVTGGDLDLLDRRTPEEIAAYEVERHDEHVKRAVEDGINELANKRIAQIGSAYQFLRLAQGMIVAGVVEPEFMSVMFSSLFDGVRSGEIELPVVHQQSMDGLAELVGRLEHMKRLGVLKLPDEFAALGGNPSPGATLELLIRLVGVTTAFDQVISLAQENAYLPWHIRDDLSAAINYAQKLEQRIETALEPVRGDFVPHATSLILEEYCWHIRYNLISPQVTEFIQRESASRDFMHEQPFGLANGIKVALGMWAFSEASAKYLTEGGTAFALKPVAALPALSSGFAPVTPGTGMELIQSNLQLVPFFKQNSFESRFEAFKEALLAHRREDFGKLPLGGKVHVLHKIDQQRIELISRCFDLTGTTFKLERASQSLILPPMASALEIRAIASFLSLEKIIDEDFPEIQMCLAGRLEPFDCAILGASIFLGSESLVRYNRDSFATNRNDHVGRRMVMYDDNGFRYPFPFDVEREGRTDVQGRKRISDFVIFQTLGTVLAYAAEDPETTPALRREEQQAFSQLRDWYCERFVELMTADPELAGVLEAGWVKSSGTDKGGSHFFDHAIVPLTEAYQNSMQLLDSDGEVGGIVGQVDALLGELANRVREIQSVMLDHPHYARQREQLFNI